MRQPFAELRDEYARLWQTMTIDPARATTVAARAKFLLGHLEAYRRITARTGVPELVIMAIHERESSGDMRCVLHNGERIVGTGQKTRLVPRGKGPFLTFEAAAIDALSIDGLSSVRDWSVERALYELELYNGFGPRKRGLHTGYLWAGTNHYSRGKYIADGQWDPNHVDRQLGCAPLMQRLIALDAALALPGLPAVRPGAVAAPLPVPVGVGGGPVGATRALQAALNSLGADPVLAVDGSYGRRTRAAARAFQIAHALEPDGLAGPKTQAAITVALAKAPAAPRSTAPAAPAAHQEETKPMPAPQTAVVPVKPATESKINWVNIVSGVAVAATAMTGGKFNLPPEAQIAIAGVLGTVTPLITVVLRTWFTKSITPASAK